MKWKRKNKNPPEHPAGFLMKNPLYTFFLSKEERKMIAFFRTHDLSGVCNRCHEREPLILDENGKPICARCGILVLSAPQTEVR